MSGWLLGLCYWKQCAQSARLSVFNPHGNHGIAWSCSVEDYRALLWLVCICAPRCTQLRRPGHCLCVSLGGFTWLWDGQVECVAMHSCAHATGLPLLPVVSLSQWEWTWMSGWLLGLCYCKQCAQSARLSVLTPMAIMALHGLVV